MFRNPPKTSGTKEKVERLGVVTKRLGVCLGFDSRDRSHMSLCIKFLNVSSFCMPSQCDYVAHIILPFFIFYLASTFNFFVKKFFGRIKDMATASI